MIILLTVLFLLSLAGLFLVFCFIGHHNNQIRELKKALRALKGEVNIYRQLTLVRKHQAGHIDECFGDGGIDSREIQ